MSSYLLISVHIWSSITAIHLEGPQIVQWYKVRYKALSDCLTKGSKLVQLSMAKLSFPGSVLYMQSTHISTNLHRAWLYTPELAHRYFKGRDLLAYKEKWTWRPSLTAALSDSWHYRNKIVLNQFLASMTYLTLNYLRAKFSKYMSVCSVFLLLILMRPNAK